MKTIRLTGFGRLKAYLNAINDNPDPQYLPAVKEITVEPIERWNSSHNALRKLFFKFPRLEKVTINQIVVLK